jgi:hypothetical protein
MSNPNNSLPIEPSKFSTLGSITDEAEITPIEFKQKTTNQKYKDRNQKPNIQLFQSIQTQNKKHTNSKS